MKVLVLEDDVLIAMDLGMMIEDCGASVIGPFHTVPDALAALDDDRPDLALLDFNVNDSTSRDIAERLRGMGVPFAFLTGQIAQHLPHELRDERIVQKPVQPAALQDLMRELAH